MSEFVFFGRSTASAVKEFPTCVILSPTAALAFWPAAFAGRAGVG